MKRHTPSILTMFNIISGFLAICIADYFISSLLIIVCLILDVLDGALARYLNAQSDIGAELDSLADLVSFGIAPAYLYFTLSPISGWMAYIPACFIVIGGTLRLAKFNVAPTGIYFRGLAIPTNAYFLMGLFLAVHFNSEIIINLLDNPIYYTAIPIFMAYMMLSPLEMFSLKEANKGLSKNKYQIMSFSIFLILMVFMPKMAVSLSVFGYIILSIIESTLRKRFS